MSNEAEPILPDSEGVNLLADVTIRRAAARILAQMSEPVDDDTALPPLLDPNPDLQMSIGDQVAFIELDGRGEQGIE